MIRCLYWINAQRLPSRLAGMLLACTLLAFPLHAQVHVLRPAGSTGVPFEKRYFGLHMHRAEAIRWPSADFGSWRLWDAGVAWGDIEKTSGSYDFSRLDRYVAFAKRFDVEVVLQLGLTPQWASRRPTEPAMYGPGRAAEPADFEIWRRFIRAMARRYAGRIHAYQIWNEANLKGFYSGDIASLVELTRIAREEIKIADPSALIIGPSAAGLLDARRDFLADFLRAGGGAQIDRMAFHLYTSQQRPEAMIDPVQDLLAQARSAGFGAMPLWNTETGYLTRSAEPGFGATEPKAISEEQAAAYLVRALVLARALGVERFHWYAWDDGKFPMTRADLATPSAVGVAYAQIIKLLEQARLFECSVDLGGVAVCHLQDAKGHPFRLAWNCRDGTTQWKTGAPVRTLSLDGSTREPGPVTGTELGAMPVVIKTSGAASN